MYFITDATGSETTIYKGSTALANKFTYTLPQANASTLGGVTLTEDMSSQTTSGVSAGIATTPKAVADYVAAQVAAAQAMIFKGTLGDSPADPGTLPTNGYKVGWTYMVSTAGTYAGQVCEAGDLVIALKDGPSTGSTVINSDWTVVQTNIDGAITTINGTTGEIKVTGSGASRTIALDDNYGDNKNPYAAKAPNYVLAGPASGSSNAAPSFRALVLADIPTITNDKLQNSKITLNSHDVSLGGSLDLTYNDVGAAAASHTHGNITNDGKLQTSDVTIANGDKLVITDSSDSDKVARASINFDGSTTTKALTPKGTFEDFLQSHQTIKQDGITGATVNRFGTCSTAAGTAAKEVAVTAGTPTLEAGLTIRVLFSNANTASTPTLSIDGGTTAKGIKFMGETITTGNTKDLLCGVCEFVYDGTSWNLIGEMPTWGTLA